MKCSKAWKCSALCTARAPNGPGAETAIPLRKLECGEETKRQTDRHGEKHSQAHAVASGAPQEHIEAKAPVVEDDGDGGQHKDDCQKF